MRFKDFIAKVDPQPRPKAKVKPKAWEPGALYRVPYNSQIYTAARILPYYQHVGDNWTSFASDRSVVVSTEGHANFCDSCELVQ